MGDMKDIDLRDWFAGQGRPSGHTVKFAVSPVSLYSRSATMTSHQSLGFLRRVLIALAGALKRGILGKSAHGYMSHFTGSDEYWDRAIAVRLGCPQKQPAKPDPDRFRSSGNAVARAGPSVRDTAGRPAEPEYEPVHGWTKRQLVDYLARNHGYRSTYEAELHKRCYATVAEVNGSSFDWFGLRRINHDKAASDTDPNSTKQARESYTDPLCDL